MPSGRCAATQCRCIEQSGRCVLWLGKLWRYELRGHSKRRRRLIATETLLPLDRSEEHTSELQSLMRISYAVFCLKKKTYQLQTPLQLSTYYLLFCITYCCPHDDHTTELQLL